MIVLGYLGFVFGESYWSYYRVREKVRESLVWAVSERPKTDQEITRQVIINALDVGVNLTPRNIRLLHSADTLTIRVIWVRELNLLFTFYDKSFEVSLTDVKRWQGGGLVIK